MNKKSSTARLIIFVEDSVDSRPFVSQFGFCRILFYFKRKKYFCVNFVLLFVLIFTIIQSILAVARGPQWCLPYAFSALPSWILFPPSLFQFQGIRLKADFIATMSFMHNFFFNLSVTNFPRNFLTTIYSWHVTRENWSLLFLLNLNLKLKTRGNNETIIFSW